MGTDRLIRTTCIVLLCLAGVAFMVYAKSIMAPIVIGIFTAFLLLPACRWLEKRKVPATLSALITITLTGVTIALLLWFLSYQFMSFSEELPLMREKLNEKFMALQSLVTNSFGISKQDQLQWLERQILSAISSSGQFAADFFSATGNFIAAATLVPIYAFFFIYYRKKFMNFIKMVTPPNRHEKAIAILETTSTVSYRYLVGLSIDIAILSVLNSIGFLLLGINHAIFLGIVAGLLNVIPYVGVIIGGIIPVMIALITKDSIWFAVGAFGVCVVVQFIDNNFITPKVIGSAVSVNPLASTIALLVGALAWGLLGMMLSIPITGVLKVVCDRVDSLKPFGYLLGEQEILGGIKKRKRQTSVQQP